MAGAGQKEKEELEKKSEWYQIGSDVENHDEQSCEATNGKQQLRTWAQTGAKALSTEGTVRTDIISEGGVQSTESAESTDIYIEGGVQRTESANSAIDTGLNTPYTSVRKPAGSCEGRALWADIEDSQSETERDPEVRGLKNFENLDEACKREIQESIVEAAYKYKKPH